MTSSVFSATSATLPDILAWIRSHLNLTPLSQREKKQLELAMEEAIVNVIRHAKSENLHLTVRQTPNRQIEFDLSDSGPPFNPLKAPPSKQGSPLIEGQHPREQGLGGKGLILMHKCIDALLYRREDDHNILTLIKKFPNKED